MKVELNKKTSEYEISVQADKKVWKDAQISSEEKLMKSLTVKGFRKGSVPKEIAKKHIAKADIFKDAAQSLMEELSKEAAKGLPKEVNLLAGPAYLINKISDSELEMKFVYPVYPDIKIGEYKNLKVKYAEKNVDDKTIDAEIEKIRSQQTMLKDKKGVIAKGDVAIFDFDGYVDNKPFDGGKAEKHQLEIGSGQFIPGFEEQMIGLKKSDSQDLKVTFPEDYHAENLRGKEATFKVKIHDVKTKEVPKLNDEFVKSSGVPNVKNVEELKAYMKKVFKEQERQAARGKFQRESFDKIIATSKDLVVPSTLVSGEIQALKQRFTEQLQQQGIKFDQYMQMTGMDDAKLTEQFRGQAETRLKDALIFAEISKAEKIEISDKDYEAEYKKLAKVYGQSEESIKKTITKEQMQIPMINDRVINVLIDSNSK